MKDLDTNAKVSKRSNSIRKVNSILRHKIYRETEMELLTLRQFLVKEIIYSKKNAALLQSAKEKLEKINETLINLEVREVFH